MPRHAGVLQERIEIAPLERRGKQALERIRGEQEEEMKSDADERHHRQHARPKDMWKRGAERRYRESPAREHRRPQQHRALVGAPDRGDLVDERQRGVGVLCDVGEAEVGGDEHLRQAEIGDAEQQELRARGGHRDRHPRRDSAPGPEHRHHGLDRCDQEAEDQRQMTELANHWLAPRCGAIFPPRFAISMASATSGGM